MNRVWKKIAVCIVCLCASTLAQAHEHSHSGYHKEFKNAGEWVKKFDDPKRDKWQKPDLVIDLLKIKEKDVVVDIGAGTGYFAFRMARKFPQAKIYAADVEDDMITYLSEQAKIQKTPNLIPFKIDPGKPNIPEKIDLAIIVDTFHHIDNRVEYLRNLRSLLTNDGRVVNIDFTMKSPEGPPVKHRLKSSEVISEFKEAGYKLDKEHHVLPYQYFLIFRATNSSGVAE